MQLTTKRCLLPDNTNIAENLLPDNTNIAENLFYL